MTGITEEDLARGYGKPSKEAQGIAQVIESILEQIRQIRARLDALEAAKKGKVRRR